MVRVAVTDLKNFVLNLVMIPIAEKPIKFSRLAKSLYIRRKESALMKIWLAIL